MVETLRVVLSRISAMLGRGKFDSDLDEELHAHIDLATEENIRRGLSRDEAYKAALREFGGVTQVRERYRAESGFSGIDTLLRDMGFAVGPLWKNSGFTTIVVLTLALGTGGNTARLALVGATLRSAAPSALTHLMRELLFGVSATDPETLGSTALLLIVVAVAACLIPAYRAAHRVGGSNGVDTDPAQPVRCILPLAQAGCGSR